MHTYDRGNLTFLCGCRCTNNPKLCTPVPNAQYAATARFRGALLRRESRLTAWPEVEYSLAAC